jgi:hypothetical protein
VDIATPTADWLNLVHELLLPVLMKSHDTAPLSHQEVFAPLPSKEKDVFFLYFSHKIANFLNLE